MPGALQEVLESLAPLALFSSAFRSLICCFVSLQTNMSRNPVNVPVERACLDHGVDGGDNFFVKLGLWFPAFIETALRIVTVGEYICV